MKRISAIVCIIIFCWGIAPALGVPDVSFNASGRVNAGFGRGSDQVEKTALCADGSVIALGRAGSGLSYSYALAKFTPQGTPDNSFGTGGVVYLNLSSFGIPSLSSDAVGLAVTPDCSAYVAGGHGPDMSVGKYGPTGALVQVYDGGETGFLLNGVAQALAVQPDGSVLVAGFKGNDFGDLAVYRYLPGGALDINFGNGGRSFVDMGLRARPASIRTDNDGKIVITGWAIPDGSPTPALTQSMIARYNSGGSLDGSFNISGVYISPVRNGRSEVFEHSLTLADGRVMAAGTSSPAEGFPAKKYVFARFTQNGHPDKFFGNRGVIVSSLTTGDNKYAFGYQNDGSIFVGEATKIHKFGPEGVIDTSYGTQGVVTLNSNVGLNSLTAAPDGKLVGGGSFFIGRPAPGIDVPFDYDAAVLRLNGNGSPDTGFDGDGTAKRDIGDFSSAVNDMALQADGKIVIAGGLYGALPFFYGTGLSRYNPDGTVDISFGDHGKVYLNQATQGNFATTVLLGVAVQPDGKIVTAGVMGFTGGDSFGVRVTRFNGDGSLDNSFGSGGVFTYMQARLNAFDVALQPDGKIVIGGFSNFDFMLMRVTAAGMLDQEFGSAGIVTTDINGYDTGISMVIQPSGKILLAGNCSSAFSDFCLTRYNANGTLDHTFGRRGKVMTDLGGEDYLSSIALAPNGYIVAAGTRRNQDTTTDLIVARYTGKGLLDASFGNSGVFIPQTPQGSYFLGQSAQVAGDGSVFVAAGFPPSVKILKLTPSGVPDQTWAPGGFLDTGINGGGGYNPDCLLDAQGRIVISGTGNTGGGFIARFATAP